MAADRGPPGTGVVTPLTKDNVKKIEQINGVKNAVGRLVQSGKLEYNDHVQFSYAASMAEGVDRKLIEEALEESATFRED